MELNKRLKLLRSEHKLTQEKFATAVGITKASVSKFENGIKTPSRETIEKIADYFNVTTDYLLGRSEDPELSEEENKIVTEEGKNIMALIESLPEDERKKAWEQLEMYVTYMQNKKND